MKKFDKIYRQIMGRKMNENNYIQPTLKTANSVSITGGLDRYYGAGDLSIELSDEVLPDKVTIRYDEIDSDDEIVKWTVNAKDFIKVLKDK